MGEFDGAGLATDRFDQGADAQVAGTAQETLAGADDQGHGILGEGVMPQPGLIELVEEEAFDGFGGQARKDDRVGDAGTDLLVNGETECLHKRRLTDQDQIVRSGEILEEQPELA